MIRATLSQVTRGACVLVACAMLVACASTSDSPEAATAPATTAAAVTPLTPAAPELDIPAHDADFEQGLTGGNETMDTAWVAARNDWSYVAVGLHRSDGTITRTAGAATSQEEEDGSLTVTLTDDATGTPFTFNVMRLEANEETGDPERVRLYAESYPEFTLYPASGQTVAVMIHQMGGR